MGNSTSTATVHALAASVIRGDETRGRRDGRVSERRGRRAREVVGSQTQARRRLSTAVHGERNRGVPDMHGGDIQLRRFCGVRPVLSLHMHQVLR